MATSKKTKPGTKRQAAAGTQTTPTGSKTAKRGSASGTKSRKKAAGKTAKAKRLKPRGKPKPRKLTAKQQAYCSWYVSAVVNMNGTEAARRAGYKGNDNTLATVAAENMRKPAICDEINKRMAVAMSGAEVTVENILRRLQVLGEKALQAGQYAPAVRSAELLGKYLKMFTDKIEHVQDFEDMDTDQLVQLLLEVVEAGGIDLGELLTGYGPDDSGLPNPPANTTQH